MNSLQILASVAVVFAGIPLGNYLAKLCEDELVVGQKYFRGLIVLSLLGGVVALVMGEDALLFTVLFIAMVTSRSLLPKSRSVDTKQ